VSNDVGRHPIFKAWSGRSNPWGPEDRYSVSFGGEVLADVVSGLDDFLRSDRWAPMRRTPAVLGCVPWLTDDAVASRLLRFDDVCIVINKPHSPPDREAVRLQQQGRGFLLDSLPSFEWMAPRVNDQPAVLGPTDAPRGQVFESVRVAGVSKRSSGGVPPYVHAKMLLLGVIWERDDHPSGYPVTFWFFEPRRLWLGSANFTYNSRRSLEFGIWSDDRALLDHAKGFLADLLAYSEPFDSEHVTPEPELAPYDFDDEAMREYAAELGPDPDDE
jgi:hypothetical protein